MRYVTPLIVMAVGFGLATTASSTSFGAEQHSVAVGTLGGTLGRLGAGLSDVFNKNQDAAKLTVKPGGGRANPALIGTGGADFGFSFTNFTATALEGKAPYKNKYPNLRVVAKFYNSC